LAPTVQVALSRDRGRLWQDARKTVPAKAVNDPIRVATCPFTGQDWVALTNGQRPLLVNPSAGKWALSFDGVDDQLSCFGMPLLSGGQTLAVAAAVAGTTGRVVNTNGGVNALIQPRRDNNALYVDGTVSTATVADASAHTTVALKASGGNWRLRYDGVDQAVMANSNDFTAPLLGWSALLIDAVPCTVYGFVPVQAGLSAAELASLEDYLKGLY
jgi:hypothetical protein